VPLAVLLTGANRRDVTQLLPLVDAITHIMDVDREEVEKILSG